MDNEQTCCGQLLVRSNNKFFGQWMCEKCNQLFDKDFTGHFLPTGMYADREQQEKHKIAAKTLAIMTGHADLFDNDNN
jgi:hypothetical protein